MRLFCDCKTDEEKSNFFLSGRAVETGIIAPATSNDVAMAYHRCAQFKKENDELRAKIVGLVNAPATKIAQLSTAPAAKLARVFGAYANQDAA